MQKISTYDKITIIGKLLLEILLKFLILYAKQLKKFRLAIYWGKILIVLFNVVI